MFKGIRDWFSERAGRAQAMHEIRHLDSGYFKVKDFTEAINPRLKYDGPGGDNVGYIRGYDTRWSQEGHQDALQGRNRSEKFQNTSYNIGWLNGMRSLREKGFRHQALDMEYDRLVREHHPKDLWMHLGVRDDQGGDGPFASAAPSLERSAPPANSDGDRISRSTRR